MTTKYKFAETLEVPYSHKRIDSGFYKGVSRRFLQQWHLDCNFGANTGGFFQRAVPYDI
jgi:hypothetical protein